MAAFNALLIFAISICCLGQDTFDSGTGASSDREKFGVARGNNTKYLIYSVNPGEGFNLHRDVYMRAAIVVQNFREVLKEDWVLVLPPWRRMYHWKSNIPQSDLPWKLFFDLESLNEFVPVMEFEDFLEEAEYTVDQVICFQGVEWSKFEEKWNEEECKKRPQYERREDQWFGEFFGFGELVHAKDYRCISVLGRAWFLLKEILTSNDMKQKRSFLIEHFEELIHETFGDKQYWDVRT
jgi:peptide-O-fucosyltransferase